MRIKTSPKMKSETEVYLYEFSLNSLQTTIMMMEKKCSVSLKVVVVQYITQLFS